MPLSVPDADRLRVISGYGGLDAPPDPSLDRITTLAARAFEVPVSLVSLVGEDRQSFRSCYGTDLSGTSRDVSFCSHAIEHDEVMVVRDARRDPRFEANPLVVGEPHIRFYAGAPLVSRDGVRFGTLCLIDFAPRGLTEDEARTLYDLAAMVVDEFELRREVEARRAAEAAVAEREARFRVLLFHSSDVITVLGADGRIAYESPSVERVLGYAPEDLIGREALSFIHPDDAGAVAEAMARAAETPGPQPPMAFRWRHSDGSWVPLEAVATNLLDDPSIQGFVVNSRDVSLNMRYAEEHEARERAEEALRLREALLNNMSHELRTPLTGILGIAGILSEELAPEQRELLGLLTRNAHRLHDTLTALFDLAQIEGGVWELEKERFDLAEAVEGAAEQYRAAAEAKGLALDVACERPVEVVLDRSALECVLDHLLANAVKFTKAGAIRVRLAREDVGGPRVRDGGGSGTGEGAGGVRLVVEDTGVGMDEAFLGDLFDPFRQESEGLDRTHEGNGLGLALVHRLVTLMEGALGVESKKGAGSRFTVRLPLALSENVPA